MKHSSARILEHYELPKIQAEIFDLGHARQAKRKTASEIIDGEDYEAFLSHYGKGIASDFA